MRYLFVCCILLMVLGLRESVPVPQNMKYEMSAGTDMGMGGNSSMSFGVAGGAGMGMSGTKRRKRNVHSFALADNLVGFRRRNEGRNRRSSESSSSSSSSSSESNY